jgi:hypothetical protein
MENWTDFSSTDQYDNELLEFTGSNGFCHITDPTLPSHRLNQCLTSFPDPTSAPGFNAAGTAFLVHRSQLLLLMSKAGAGSSFLAQQSIAPQNDTNSTWEPPPSRLIRLGCPPVSLIVSHRFRPAALAF